MPGCNPSFQSEYAKFDGIGTKSVNEYIEGDFRHITPRCIPNNHHLVLVNGPKRCAHFRHKNTADLEGPCMTNWHAEWQSHFPITEKTFRNQYGQIKERRADVVIPEFNRILEIQHSLIDEIEVSNRNKDYALHGYNVTWIIDAQNGVIVKNMGGRRILSFDSIPWLYERFLSCETVYYDINGFMYQVNPNHIKSHQIDVMEPMLKSDFIDALKMRETLFIDTPPQSYLHVKQQGAGSGKTYGMIQLLNSDPEITHYEWILFITKQHSAVNVMYSEFKRQYDEGKLYNIEIISENLDNCKEIKKNIINYRHKITNIETCVIFATVDSFTCAVGQASQNASNKFTSIVKSIKDGYSKIKRSGSLKFATIEPFINKETGVFIDEAQDLTELYGEAFLKFVSSTQTNLYIVGDQLQSLANTENTLTFLHRAEAAGLRVIKTEASNLVRRFSDPQLIRFVNSMIPFERYDLPKMTPEKNVREVPGALTVFKGEIIYANQSKDDKSVVKAVAEIIELFTKEIINNKRVPEDFLFVTPFTGKNPLIESLQIAINMKWKDLMENDITYIQEVKSKHPYWSSINPSDYTRYAIFHKSQEMGSINLSDSKHATRMVSIHSSKGDGRNVVFVIGVTQAALQVFSDVAGNLIYESLLHVALTRQKESLYFRLEANHDDIHQRISNSSVDISAQSNTTFDFAKDTIKMSNISNDILNFSFDTQDGLYENIICQNELPRFPPPSEKKLLIDMGDHNIRYASMFMNIIVHICNHTHSETKKQLYAILGSLKLDRIKPVTEWKDYINILFKNRMREAKPIEKFIPLLQFKVSKSDRDYNKYYTIIYQTMQRICSELDLVKSKEMRYFCPLESIVLYYMIECMQRGTYQAITINDVYNIVDTYRHAFDSSARGHEHCNCKNHFPPTNIPRSESQKKQEEYLRNHYDRVIHVSKILDNFVAEHPKVSWLYQHGVKYNGPDDLSDFTISKGFPLLGYDDNQVYTFNIKPQFNELNYNEVMVDTLCDTWLIGHTSSDSENYKKFNEKPVISCIISLNLTELYTVNWTRAVNEHRDFLENLIYDTVFKKFKTKHEQYYNTFISVLKTYDSIPKIIDICKKKSDDNIKIAPYISKVWTYIEGQLDDVYSKSEKRGILEKYTAKEAFIKMFDQRLRRSLIGFLDMVEEEE